MVLVTLANFICSVSIPLNNHGLSTALAPVSNQRGPFECRIGLCTSAGPSAQSNICYKLTKPKTEYKASPQIQTGYKRLDWLKAYYITCLPTLSR